MKPRTMKPETRRYLIRLCQRLVVERLAFKALLEGRIEEARVWGEVKLGRG